jgi:2-polyprenyl-6-hydroxyphenyl methylase/3-demethylubiquinone-9 3-methyltransferase
MTLECNGNDTLKAPGSNFDQNELVRFDGQADQWWQLQGPFKALHQINPVRLAYLSQRIRLRGKKVLDVGCGGGLLCEPMAEQGAQVTGIDMAPKALAVARAHARQRRLDIQYQLSTAEAWSGEHAEAYDVVTCMELVEHVPDPAELVRACAALVRPGGHIFFATVNRTWLARLLVIGVSENILGIVRKGTHQFQRFVRPTELSLWAAQVGLHKADIKGLRFLPYIGYARLCKDTRMNYLMDFVKR